MTRFTKLAIPFVLMMWLMTVAAGTCYAQAQDLKKKRQSENDLYEILEAEKASCRQKVEKRDEVIEGLRDRVKELTRAAEDAKARIEVCSGDASLGTRVVCYDEIARDHGFKTSSDIETQEDVIEEYGFWKVSRRVNHMGDEVIYLKVDSVEPVVSRAGTKRTPSFVIRCSAKKTDVFLDWKSPLADYKVFIQKQAIIYKLDSDRLTNESWDLSADNHAAFCPEPIEFVKKMTDRKKLVMIVTPYSDKSATLVFPLKGLPQALELLVKHCYNK